MKKMLIFLVGLVFFTVTDQRILEEEAKKGRISETFYLEEDFRSQPVSETFLEEIGNFEDPGEAVGFYFLETNYGEDTFYLTDAKILTETERLTDTKKWKKRMDWWQRQRGYEDYADTCRQIWNDVQYFPVASGNGADENRITFGNSWMQERTYGGKRGHEGTDLMPKENKRGTYPIVSMTDGIVSQKGWLEKGGYRLGILAPGGAYFYYAHLDSYANLKEGDPVKAGDFLGFMGDSGYGEEGTTGKFPVHLHVGIYLNRGEQEISINPYPVLCYLKDRSVNSVRQVFSTTGAIQEFMIY